MDSLKITMTLLVRNEEDIIEQNIRYHAASGVDRFIVMDNLSTDRTAQIINELSKEFRIDYIYQPDDTYDQAIWVTSMAIMAAIEHQADWVINCDADEFWVHQEGNFKSMLGKISRKVSVISVQRHNAVPIGDTPEAACSTPENSIYFERNSINCLGHPLPAKVLHRASSKVWVGQGNHHVNGIGGEIIDAGQELEILHFPYRSFENYCRKIRFGGDAYLKNTNLHESIGSTWREHRQLLDTRGLSDFWASISQTHDEILRSLNEGDVFKMDYLKGYFFKQKSISKSKSLDEILLKLRDETHEIVNEYVKKSEAILSNIDHDRKLRFPMYYNMPAHLNGAYAHLRRIGRLAGETNAETLCGNFPNLRDTFSLFPQNKLFKIFLADLLKISQGPASERLLSDCKGKRVILVTSCHARHTKAKTAFLSFANLDRDIYKPIILLGSTSNTCENGVDLSFAYDGSFLSVPISDSYEHLHRKLFFAYMILDLIAQPEMVLKQDDDLILSDPALFQATLDYLSKSQPAVAGRLVGSKIHKNQLHGWHIDKCGNELMESRGYQYPLPARYPAGGYGYVFSREGLEACSYMYLAMKEFFNMAAIGLEDAYVGHALYASGLECTNIADPDTLLCFPGMTTTDFKKKNL